MSKGVDPSVGDRRKVHGHTIQGKTVNTMLAPPDLSQGDLDGMYGPPSEATRTSPATNVYI